MSNVDSPQTTHIGLCAGYGGIELGLRRAIPTLRSVAFCEIEAFACANLVAKMEAGLLDQAPIWTNLKTFPWESFRDRVDILTGGYPCQPFSAAGKRAGEDDPRHLWPFIASGIRLLRPRICFFENVEGHISLGLSNVIEDLAGLGYRTTWGIFSASEVGAPHQRKRVFIMANRIGTGLEGLLLGTRDDSQGREDAGRLIAGCGEAGWVRVVFADECEGHPEEGCICPQCGDYYAECECPGPTQDGYEYIELQGILYARALANANSAGIWEDRKPSEPRAEGVEQSSGDCRATDTREGHQVWPSRPCEQQFAWEPPRVVGNPNSSRLQEWQRQRGASIQGVDADGGKAAERQAQPPMGRDAHGSADWMDDAKLFVTCDNRTDELRLLGNGVVPATAERAFRLLMEELA